MSCEVLLYYRFKRKNVLRNKAGAGMGRNLSL